MHDNAASALGMLSADFPGILVTDLKMEGIDGMELLRRAQEIDPELPVVVITGHGDVETAVEAMRLGAYDFIEKPFVPERFLDVVRRASEKRQLVIENRRLRRAVNEQTLASRIIGTSKAAETLRSAVAELAGTDVSVILYGETGVGKDLIARCLHDFGQRQKGNYVAVNCAAIPDTMVESEFFGHEAGAFTSAVKSRPGKIEHASGGTLFLDEIDSMPLATQGKLLRVLQERSVERLGSNQSIAVDLRPSRRARSICARRARRRGSAAISITGSRWSSCRYRRCASAWKTSRCCSNISPRPRRQAHGRELAPDVRRDREPADGAGLARQRARTAQRGGTLRARARRLRASARRGEEAEALARRAGRCIRARRDRALASPKAAAGSQA